MTIKREELSKIDYADVASGENMGPVHPGEHLAEFLEDFDITQYRLAKEIHVPPRRINEIVKKQRAISIDTALRLARYFGNSAQFWIRLQEDYDLKCAEAELSETLAAIKPHAA